MRNVKQKEGIIMFRMIAVTVILMLSGSALDLVKIDVPKHAVKDLDRIGVIINQVQNNSIIAEIDENMYSQIENRGYKITVLQKNIDKVYLHNFLDISDRGQYLTYDQFRDSMISMATIHSSICQLDTLGYSHQNRLLLVMKISDNASIDENEPAIHLEGNIHGDEKIGWAVNFNMIPYLLSNYGSDTTVQRLVNNREIWIAPLVNPDGYVNSSRYNARTVDLNRNWGWMWGNESACGSDFFSENESWKFQEYFWRQPFVIYGSYHAGTKYISEPWSYTDDLAPPEQNLIRHLSQGYAAFTAYPYGQGSIGMYPINGATKDYDYGCCGEMAWSIEVCFQKTPSADSIDPIFNRDRPAMMYLMHKAGQGIHGSVSDIVTGDPLYALIKVGPANWYSYSCPNNGDFHRFYLPGTYTVTAIAPGYDPVVINNVVVPSGTPDSSVTLNIQMSPNPNLPIYATRVIGTRYLSVVNLTYPVSALGPQDSQSYQLDGTKWIVLGFDFPIRNGPGNDFSVYRSSGTGSALVRLSNNWRGPWQTVGTASSPVSSFDISSAGFDSVAYIRLEASSTFMLDAIEAVQIIPGAEENGSIAANRIRFSPTVVGTKRIISVNNIYDRPVKLTLYNVIGQKQANFLIGQGVNKLDLHGLPAGIYFMRDEISQIGGQIVIAK